MYILLCSVQHEIDVETQQSNDVSVYDNIHVISIVDALNN